MPAWLMTLDRFFPVRLLTLALAAAAFVGGALAWWAGQPRAGWLAVAGALGLAQGLRDLLQTRHALLRNYPLIGHVRFLLEWVRPEIRQYFIDSDRDAVPFSRQQRSLVYQRAKGQSDKRPFGTQLDVRADGYEWINHSVAPSRIASHDFRVLIGGSSGPDGRPGSGRCSQPYSASLFNISAMSFGALSANAILALNGGAKKGGFMHDTGEGSISAHHRVHGGDLVWEIGSGYFGCRHADGRFSAEAFAATAADSQVKLIELKLSQGAKPGHGGMLPGPKVTPEIAAARGVPVGEDCISPAGHSAFATPVEMLQFIDRLRTLSGGKPVGFKFCVGHPWEWFAIAKAMLETGLLPDFIVVDGAEGGTGAAPLEFTDHVGAPLQEGLRLVHNTLVGLDLRERITLGCAGKIVSAFDIARAMALGADWCNSARGFMFALGCIQAQHCHTGACPTGVATQDAARGRALVVPDKIERVARFHQNTLEALRELVQAAGLGHPRQIQPQHIMRRNADHQVRSLETVLPTVKPGALLAAIRGEADWPLHVFARYWHQAAAHSFQPVPVAVPPEAARRADNTLNTGKTLGV
ncbi:FMN-binding glutamate synthase family protein [Aquabacterium sp. OR-4]|uniref:FMN-binding glutamate synthase family protein n=1 Tax=Aquabacterium sp. OR-4 TaxID=2978127 RepID=UPI0021B40380|nr:FMN-binding glutamate synthase family protein [Aquabacterium sp. OR-4]MDT7834363.1 FMN-binding glutamate synthase family protein [Aquabacterium sp. OR-4]